MPNVIMKRILSKTENDVRFSKDIVDETITLFIVGHRNGLKKVAKSLRIHDPMKLNYDAIRFAVIKKQIEKKLSPLEKASLATNLNLERVKVYFNTGKSPTTEKVSLPVWFWYDFYFSNKFPSEKEFFEKVLPMAVYDSLIVYVKLGIILSRSVLNELKHFSPDNLKLMIRVVDDKGECMENNVCILRQDAKKLYELLAKYRKGKFIGYIPDVESVIFVGTTKFYNYVAREKLANELLKKHAVGKTNLVLAPFDDILRLTSVPYSEMGMNDRYVEKVFNTPATLSKFDETIEVWLPIVKGYHVVVPLESTNVYREKMPAIIFHSSAKKITLPGVVADNPYYKEVVEKVKKKFKVKVEYL